jgi:hypothetical protein
MEFILVFLSFHGKKPGNPSQAIACDESDGVKEAVAPIMACFLRIKTIRGRYPAASCGVLH